MLVETAADRAAKEREAMSDRQWRAVLDSQDRRLARNDALRGPEKPSVTERICAWLSGPHL